MYVIFEYLLPVAVIFVLAAFFFAVSVVALICQEGGKRLAANAHKLSKHPANVIAEHLHGRNLTFHGNPQHSQ